MSSADTIAAIATPPGNGSIGIVRLSGPAAPAIAGALLGRPPRPRHAHFCRFLDAGGQAIDHGLLIHFPAPHSFTGEHVVELQAHGSPVALRRLLARTVELGARQARPGEFSERAFLNGRLDLAQAEAIADLIAAGSEAAARSAMRSLDGAFSHEVRAVTEATIRLRVWIEAAIDFPEEEIDFLAAPELAKGFADLGAQVTAVLAGARRGTRLADGLHVVIVGRPNTGKSSLLNALAAAERAIVTDIPGTTRDVLRESIDLDGVALTLVDTAGLREADDRVEQEGIRRARAELAKADVAILVTDDVHAETDRALLQDLPAAATRLIVHNKIDLDGLAPRSRIHDGALHLWLSAQTGAGLPLLTAELERLAGRGETGEGSYSARARHVAALERASASLQAAESALIEARAGELAAEELRQVQHALGEITGEFSDEDLLGRIFADFCIGK
jgi:tRNA modification GTPase